MNIFYHRTALITGASGGLGADFARQLAQLGCHLILTARREEALAALAGELREKSPQVRVQILPMDLSRPGAVEDLDRQIEALGLSVDILINNAGFGSFGPFHEIPWEKESSMLQLDVVALVQATKIFGTRMKARGWGKILQLGSIGAFQPTPLYASYSAAKAFVLSYGLAVNQELKGTGVTCTVLNPGVTSTDFLTASGQKMTAYQRLVMMTSPQVATVGLKALAAGRKTVVPGLANKASAVLTRFIGRGAAAALAESLMK